MLDRAQRRGIPAYYLPYSALDRSLFEYAAITILRGLGVDLVVLAGFMRILTPHFVTSFPRRIVNIHPSLLPAYRGSKALERSYNSADSRLGVTVHYVDEGLDSGEIICHESFSRVGDETFVDIEKRIHAVEHRVYPEAVGRLLDVCERD